MSEKKKKTELYIPDQASKYKDNTTRHEKETVEALHREYDSKNTAIPPLSQSEQEHLTYLAVLSEYNRAKAKRTNYRKYGAMFIIISGIVFLALIFSLDLKIEFLCIWVASIFYCVTVMIRAEYQYHTFKEFLGIADEFDYYGIDEDEIEPESPPPIPPAVSDPALQDKNDHTEVQT